MQFFTRTLCALFCFVLLSLTAGAQTAAFTWNDSCQGANITFTSTSTSCGSCTYAWNFGDNTTSTSQNPVKAFATAGTFNVKLVVTSGSVKDSITQQVKVNHKPLVKFGPADFCQSTEFTLYDSSTVNGTTTGVASWSWRATNGTVTRTSVNQTFGFNATTAGNWNVKLKVTSSSGCVDSLEKVINVLAKPNVGFTFVRRCFDSSITFTNTTTIQTPATIASYFWEFSDNTTYTSTNVVKTFSAPGAYTAKLLVTASTGCKDSMIQNFIVYDYPVPNFEVINTCEDSGLMVINKSSVVYGPIVRYEYDFGDSKPVKVITPTNYTDTFYYIYDKAGQYNIKLTTITQYGCRDTITKTVIMYALPRVRFDINNNTNAGCKNDSIQFTDQSTIATPSTIAQYFWNFDDTLSGQHNFSTAQNPKHLFSAPGTYRVKLAVITNNGCRDSLYKNITIHNMPIVYFDFYDKCKDSLVEFTNYTTDPPGGAITAYTWNFGDGSNNKFQKDVTHTYTVPGKYAVTLTADTDKGCKVSYIDTIEVFDPPAANFSWTGQCQRNNIAFQDSSTLVSGNIIGWRWDFGDGNASFSQNPVHRYQGSGSFNVRLTVTSSNGCIGTRTKQINVLPAPAPNFTSSAGCDNVPVQFTNTTTIAGGTTITGYFWDFGDGNTSTDKDPAHTYPAQGAYQVYLVASSANGCSDTSEKKAIIVNAVPNADFTFKSVCNDSAVVFTDNSTITGGFINTYQWNFGDGKTSNAKNPQHVYDTAGTFNVRVLITSLSGCTDSATKQVVVYPKPVSDFNFTSACSDTAISFTDASTVANGTIIGWIWNFGDGGTDSTNNPNPTYKFINGGKYNVTLTTISDLGCQGVTTKEVEVYRRPKVDFYQTGGIGGNYCLNSTITFVDATLPPIDATIIGRIWFFGDGDTSTQEEPTHVYAYADTFNVTLVVMTNRGCVDSLTKQVIVRSLPELDFSFKGGCKGEPVFFTDISPESESGFWWDFGDGQVVFLRHPTKVYANPGVYTVKFRAQNQFGCYGDTVIKQVTVYERSDVQFTATEACAGSHTFFTDSTNTNGSNVSPGGWFWEFGDRRSSTEQNPIHLYRKPGTYSVKLTVKTDAGCIDSIRQNVIVNETPTAIFSPSPPSVTIQKPVVTFNNGSVGDDIIFWDFGDGFTSTEKSPTHSYMDTGNYRVTLIIQNAQGCSDTLIDTISVKPGYVIYVPNVVTSNGDDLNDYFLPKGDGISDYLLMIYNQFGQEIFRTTDINEPWKATYYNSTERVPEGVYLWVITIVDYANDEIKRIAGNVTVVR